MPALCSHTAQSTVKTSCSSVWCARSAGVRNARPLTSFGKTGVFFDGVMFAMVTENTLYFRVDDQNRATFKEAQSFPPLNYAKKGRTIDLSFWRVPERLFDEPDELVVWARAALAAARR